MLSKEDFFDSFFKDKNSWDWTTTKTTRPATFRETWVGKKVSVHFEELNVSEGTIVEIGQLTCSNLSQTKFRCPCVVLMNNGDLKIVNLDQVSLMEGETDA